MMKYVHALLSTWGNFILRPGADTLFHFQCLWCTAHCVGYTRMRDNFIKRIQALVIPSALVCVYIVPLALSSSCADCIRRSQALFKRGGELETPSYHMTGGAGGSAIPP
eukprot:12353301-Ditylum_brightwellii.AAC.1